MRINKYIALCGAASRRKAEEYISQGKVTVNNEVVYDLGHQIDENNDLVYVDGKRLYLPDNMEYYVLNKPKGYVCSSAPQGDDKSAISLIKTNARIFTVGRLDKDSEGLIILTNDGDFANRVIHPSFNNNKHYYVEVKGDLTDEKIERLQSGIELDGKMTSKAKIYSINRKPTFAKFNIIIHEGMNRQIRRMCEACELKVTYLKRTRINSLDISDLNKGEYKKVTLEELEKSLKKR